MGRFSFIISHENHSELNSSKSRILYAALIIGLPILIITTYNYSAYTLQFGGFTLKKIDFTTQLNQPITSIKKRKPNELDSKEKTKVINDLLKLSFNTPMDTVKKPAKTRPKFVKSVEKDVHIPQRILLIGDSETGGLLYPLNDYCAENGHELEVVFTWFSASILNFGYSEKTDEILEKYKPTFVIFVVGLNEMYASDLDRRAEAAQLFLEKLGDTPYLWVGPANYTTDRGINNVFESTAAPGFFFMSKDLDLPRGKDNRHPNQEGYNKWMDYIASFIQSNKSYPFNFLPPKRSDFKVKSKIILANAAKDKGY